MPLKLISRPQDQTIPEEDRALISIRNFPRYTKENFKKTNRGSTNDYFASQSFPTREMSDENTKSNKRRNEDLNDFMRSNEEFAKIGGENLNTNENSIEYTKYNAMPRFNAIRSIAEECINDDDLLDVIRLKNFPVCYDGFEPSGRMHIAQGIMKTNIVNKLTANNCKYKIWIADWFAMLNNKMGGDLEKIKIVGLYMIELWKACGMNLENVEFVWASDEINKNPNKYWSLVMDIAKNNTLKRVIRCSQIMGRDETDDLTAAQIFYPCMQCADIFFLNVDICQLGLDQRKVNMLAREYSNIKKMKHKPVILSHHMLLGLSKPVDTKLIGVDRGIELKMSKSKPDSCIFMTDSEEEIKRKFNKAYCPEKVVEDNPVLEYCKYIVFEKVDKLLIERPNKWGGNLEFNNYQDLEKAFVKGELHPADLKIAVAREINKLLIPVREHFENNNTAKKLKKLVESYQVTR